VSALDDPRRKLLRVALSVVGAGVLLYLLFRAVDWSEAWGVLKQLSPAAWLAAFAVHASVYVLRTLRFASLIPDRRVPFTHLWSIQAANQMASLLLPMRTGEITYPIYLRNAGVPLEVGVAGLIVSRSLDLLAVLTIAVFSAIWLRTPIEHMPPGTGIPAVLVVALIAAALLAVATGGAPFIRWCAMTGARLGLSYRFIGRIEQVARGFETVGRYRALAEAFTLTLLIWIGVDLFYYILMSDLGFGQLGPTHVAFGASAAILTNLLPVNTFAGLGTQEYGWTWGFESLGVTRSSAAASALAVHVVQLVNVGLLGMIAQFRLHTDPRREQAQVARVIAERRARLEREVRALPPDLCTRRPSPNEWSVAEVLEHLALVEESIVARMRELLAQPGDHPAGRRVRVPLFVVSWRLPSLRVAAPKAVLPTAQPSVADSLARLARSREGLTAALASADDSTLRGKRFRHQVLGALDLLEWAEFVSYHELRHLAQIRAVARAASRVPLG